MPITDRPNSYATKQNYDLMGHLNDIPFLGRQYVPKFWSYIEAEEKSTSTIVSKNENVKELLSTPSSSDNLINDAKPVHFHQEMQPLKQYELKRHPGSQLESEPAVKVARCSK